MFKIVTDSTADLPVEYLKEHDLGCMNLSYIMDGVTYGQGQELPEKEFYALMRQGKMPTTSQVNPEEAKAHFTEYLKENKEILCIAFSSGLSGTYNSMRIAADEIMEEQPDCKIIVIDSLCASLGEGLLVHKAVALRDQGKSMEEVMKTVQDAVLTIAMILLIVGGGGALKQVLIDSGVGTYIGNLVAGSDLSPLLLAWLVAAVIRTACGSATVAALTAGGIAAPICAVTGANPELMVLATGAGSLIFSPPNDPGFWLFKEFFGLTVKQTVRTWCALETIIAVMGLAGVLVLNLFVG